MHLQCTQPSPQSASPVLKPASVEVLIQHNLRGLPHVHLRDGSLIVSVTEPSRIRIHPNGTWRLLRPRQVEQREGRRAYHAEGAALARAFARAEAEEAGR